MADRKSDERAGADADARLMVAAAGGSEAAYGDLIRRHQRGLLNFFHRLGADVHEAEDAVQETLLRVFSYRRKYVPSAPFSVFLFTLGRHAWVDLRRRRARWRRAEGPAEPLDLKAADRVLDPGDRMDLEEALKTLSPGHRMVLVLSLFEGLRYDEISKVMGIPVGTVKSRVFHALRKLRERMASGQQT